MIAVMPPPQSTEAAFPKFTVHVENFHLDGLVVGCGRDDQQPDYKPIKHGEEYTLEFNDDAQRSCAFNWNNKHIKFPVFNHTLSNSCTGGIIKDCWWRARERFFEFLENDWVLMYYW
ncbi:hypothetical protein L1987_35830 [Smallanthus sonchifolius]|uniref:Uncharacterized protein n=1 Tax=Smallanthus sonchifolius TaxID=185202 RepID=A0ACB9HBR9_9ASTR|nr:hypothetical protein L1987_35830 [Smallanthus sonchifolius]